MQNISGNWMRRLIWRFISGLYQRGASWVVILCVYVAIVLSTILWIGTASSLAKHTSFEPVTIEHDIESSVGALLEYLSIFWPIIQ